MEQKEKNQPRKRWDRKHITTDKQWRNNDAGSASPSYGGSLESILENAKYTIYLEKTY